MTVADRAPELADRLEVVPGDALRVTELPGPPPTALVANLPYNVAVPVVLHLLATFPSLRHGLVMVQAEVADRLTAGPGGKVYGVPSVKMAWYADTHRAGNVGRAVFWPAPNVDSGLVAFARRDQPSTTATREKVFAVIDAAFAQRRKTLRAALSGWAGSARRRGGGAARRGRRPRRAGRVPGRDGLYPDRRTFPYDPVTVTTVRVPAKVNLQLSVGPVREDGYHDLVNVFHAVSLFDEVTASPADDAADHARGPVRASPPGPDNLAARAARPAGPPRGRRTARRAAHPQGHPGRGRHGGRQRGRRGALVACDALWGTGAPQETLLELGAELGSDVPFALLGGTAVGLGRGERLTAVEATGEFHWVFGFADGGLSTPRVYGECDRLRGVVTAPRGRSVSDELMAALKTGDAAALGHSLTQRPASGGVEPAPVLVRRPGPGAEPGALGALVSGSGPTCAFLAASAADAEELASDLTSTNLFASVRQASGPVPGAVVDLGCGPESNKSMGQALERVQGELTEVTIPAISGLIAGVLILSSPVW